MHRQYTHRLMDVFAFLLVFPAAIAANDLRTLSCCDWNYVFCSIRSSQYYVYLFSLCLYG